MSSSKRGRRRVRRAGGSGSLFQRKPGGPWYGQYFDASGRRVQRSTGSPERAVAERIMRGWISGVALRQSGTVSAIEEAIEDAARCPAVDHLHDYLAACEAARQAPRAIVQKRRAIEALLAEERVLMLADLDVDAVRRYLGRIVGSGRSARTHNHKRAAIAAFLGWLKSEGRVVENPLAGKRVPKLDEERDQRRRRRALTQAEQERLLRVAHERGRWLWYAMALRAGFRRGDLVRLRWRDLDLDEGLVEIRHGKARRVDTLPLVEELLEALRAERQRVAPSAGDRVFPTAVTDRTRLRDFERAGLARRVPVLDEAGAPEWIGKGKRRRQRTLLTAIDEDGFALDLHGLRGTLCTDLLRAGVPVPHAQRLMRHSDARTTLKHYSRLTITDLGAAVASLPKLAAAAEPEQQRGRRSASA
jgi:integrase